MSKSKTFSKEQLVKKAQGEFKNYPKAKSLFATEDGNFFLDSNRAKLHAGTKLKMVEIENENFINNQPVNEPEKVKPANHKDLINESKTLETVEEVVAKLSIEQSLEKPRPSVVKAYKERIEVLNSQATQDEEE